MKASVHLKPKEKSERSNSCLLFTNMYIVHFTVFSVFINFLCLLVNKITSELCEIVFYVTVTKDLTSSILLEVFALTWSIKCSMSMYFCVILNARVTLLGKQCTKCHMNLYLVSK